MEFGVFESTPDQQALEHNNVSASHDSHPSFCVRDCTWKGYKYAGLVADDSIVMCYCGDEVKTLTSPSVEVQNIKSQYQNFTAGVVGKSMKIMGAQLRGNCNSRGL
eukprot:GHVU01104895.1.p5 GENE.GHVU01104895.1~~GHVU01104895.1.p5  ORF type:complete len:106 (-),score=6.66 GHVU01104895.1:2391-2708(-)